MALSESEVNLGRMTAAELDPLRKQIKSGQCAMSELKDTLVLKRIMQNK